MAHLQLVVHSLLQQSLLNDMFVSPASHSTISKTKVTQFTNRFNTPYYTMCGAVVPSADDVCSGADVPGRLPGPSP